MRNSALNYVKPFFIKGFIKVQFIQVRAIFSEVFSATPDNKSATKTSIITFIYIFRNTSKDSLTKKKFIFLTFYILDTIKPFRLPSNIIYQ